MAETGCTFCALRVALCAQTFFVVQLLSRVWLFATPWTAARQASLSFTISWSLLKLMSTELVMPSNHLILCLPLLLLPSSFPSIRVFSTESAFLIMWPRYLDLFLHSSPVAYWTSFDLGGVHLLMPYLFAFLYYSWDSPGRNTGVGCHFLIQWTTFCQNSPPWPIHLGSPCRAWLITSLSYASPFAMTDVWSMKGLLRLSVLKSHSVLSEFWRLQVCSQVPSGLVSGETVLPDLSVSSTVFPLCGCERELSGLPSFSCKDINPVE